jgi:putative transposase
MGKRTKHSGSEIASKLAQASDLQRQGKLQSEIARTLGVSIMTLHRWRKLSPTTSVVPNSHPAHQIDQNQERSGRGTDIQLENLRLRRLVTDLLLEKMNLQEELEALQSPAGKASKKLLARP